MSRETFGAYLKRKRLEREYTLRGFAGMMDVSPVYICDLEKDRKTAPTEERMEQIVRLLSLDKHEKEILYDLAALTRVRPSVSSDLPEYIMEHEIVRVALRTAKDVDATDEEWQEFIEKLNQRIRKKGAPSGEVKTRESIQQNDAGDDCPERTQKVQAFAAGWRTMRDPD